MFGCISTTQVRAAAVMCLLLAGCAPCRHLPTYQRDTVYVHRIDSLWLRDSIYVDREKVVKERGDTVYVTERVTEFRDRWRDRVKIDTLYRDREVVRTEYVEREPGKWEVFWQQLGKVFAGVLALAAVVVLVRRIFFKR